MNYTDFFEKASCHEPYPWQIKVAEQGLPTLIQVPTGTGKTEGVLIAWLYRKLNHPNTAVREATPNRLILASPMRTLVDQQKGTVEKTLLNLGLEHLPVSILEGGMTRRDNSWREIIGEPSILIGTIDMLISRALNRGYGSTIGARPLEFGIINNDSHWIFDEIQLMGPSLPTSRQLDSFRNQFGTFFPCYSTWMSATPNKSHMKTIDNPDINSTVTLDFDDTSHINLKKCIEAKKKVSQLQVTDDVTPIDAMVKSALDMHDHGTRTILICNTVNSAKQVYENLKKKMSSSDRDEIPVYLLHSQFRPFDRFEHSKLALNETIGEKGIIIISTQVIEAGVDISAKLLITEVAPGPSILQRIGRCNRSGEFDIANVFWVKASPSKSGLPLPYNEKDIDQAINTLVHIEGKELTSHELHDHFLHAQDEFPQPFQVLRKKDFTQLFDNSLDLSGTEIDVSRFIRESDDIDVFICWREVAEDGLSSSPTSENIRSDELCRINIIAVKKWLEGKEKDVWFNSNRRTKEKDVWRVIGSVENIRPGMTLVCNSKIGGYNNELGFDASLKVPVDPVNLDVEQTLDSKNVTVEVESDLIEGDKASFIGQLVSIRTHLDDAEREAKNILDRINCQEIDHKFRRSIETAAANHDIGKVHSVFQSAMAKSIPEGITSDVDRFKPLAKSVSDKHISYDKQYFRHELASLAILREHSNVIMSEFSEFEKSLVQYLVASHHGKVRVTVRGFPDEVLNNFEEEELTILGVSHGEQIAGLVTSKCLIPETTVDLNFLKLGSENSWTSTVSTLFDEIGPIKLAFMESVVRLADWEASDKEARNNGK